uniref:SH3 domain-containing protein n=1 Tax=Mesocestoides corti TaxID=53468 RepID=A0A5K3ERW3_MESCO
ICAEVDAATSQLLNCRRVEWKLRKKAFLLYRQTCQALTTGNTSKPPTVGAGGGGVGGGGGNESVNKTRTLLLRKRLPDRTSSTSSALNKTLRRSATLSTSHPATELEAVDSPVAKLAEHPALPSKVARAVWRSVSDYYRSILASEDARIEWHSAIFQNAFKLYALERLRLNNLLENLNAYRSTITDSLQAISKAISDTKDASLKANPKEDFVAFHELAFLPGPGSTSQSPLVITRPVATDLSKAAATADPSRLVSIAPRYQCISPAARSQRPCKPPEQRLAVVASSKQSLLFIPGEVDSLYVPSAEIRQQSIQRALQKRFLVPARAETPHISDDALEESRKKSEKAAFSRQLLMAIVDILARECQKEERTKQGLTNLVQVYSTTPLYANEETLAEARRRLFFSRCRLAYLCACRARLACLFAQESADGDKSKPPRSLHIRLSEAGFEASSGNLGTGLESVPADLSALKRYASSLLSRSVPVLLPPSLPEGFTKNVLEWPPVTPEISDLEVIPPDDLQIYNPYLAMDLSRFSWMAYADTLFSGTGSVTGSSVTDENDAIVTDSDFEDDFEGVKIETAKTVSAASKVVGAPSATKPLSKPSKVVSGAAKRPSVSRPAPIQNVNGDTRPNNSKVPETKTTVTKNQSIASEKSSIERFPVKLAKDSPTKSPTQRAPSRPSSYASTCRSTPQSTAASTASFQTPAKAAPATKKASRPTSVVGKLTKQSPHAGQRATTLRHTEKKLAPLKVDAKPRSVALKGTVHPETKPNAGQSKPTTTSPPTSPAFSPVLDSTDAFMDDDVGEENSDTAQIGPLSRTIVHEERLANIGPINGCGDVLSHDVNEKLPDSGACSQTESLKEDKKKKNPSSIFSLLGRKVNGGKKPKHQRPQIEAPWRVEPDANGLASGTDGAPDGDLRTLPDSASFGDTLHASPSNFSLHCIGWAKVITSYAPQKPGELSLLEGEIVSILQKTSPTWWIGEAGGNCGRFPVANVEEF